MSKAPLVSVIIPCFNYAAYLAEAIDSALAQTHTNTEVIVMDDGSTDNSKQVAGRYAGRIEYFYQENQGLSATRNNGFRKASGDFIVFLDADDRLDPHFIEKTLAVAQEWPAAGFVYTQQQYFEASTEVTTYPAYQLPELKKRNFIAACTLIRAEALRKCSYDPWFTSWEDWDFYLSLAEKHIGGRLLDEPLVLYRKHHDQKSMLDTFDERTKVRTLAHLRYKHWRLYGIMETLRFTAWYLKHR